MKIEDAEIVKEDLDTMVEIARQHMNAGAWLQLAHSANELRAALEKQIPKEARYEYTDRPGVCDGCGQVMPKGKRYCDYCGQAMKWTD